MSPPLTGTCNCGAVQFSVTEPFVSSTYCHCTRCQRRTGTGASANARVAAAAFSLVRGSDRLRSWKPADGAEKFFCGDCGSAMFSRSGADWVGVRLGVLDSDPGIRPGARQFVAYAAPWEPLPDDGLPGTPSPRSPARPTARPGVSASRPAGPAPRRPGPAPPGGALWELRAAGSESKFPECVRGG